MCTWGRDDLGDWYINTTCEGIGASIWWPNKDIGYDEPDHGMNINVTVPENLVAVSNGRLERTSIRTLQAKTKTFHWEVVNPINNYGVNVNIGNYVNWSRDNTKASAEHSISSYWVLPHQKEAAMQTFKEVPRMLKAFEYWFGKYPFYEDGYKLVTVSYPGMEHQSSVTYGNYFRNGYRERDVSGTGVGYKFDFIIVHESAHEWCGNNISMRDAADMWIHEGFANYAENLFVEYYLGKKARSGLRHRHRGEISAMTADHRHLRRQPRRVRRHVSTRAATCCTPSVRSSTTMRNGGRSCRAYSRDFWHQTVTTQQIESYITRKRPAST